MNHLLCDVEQCEMLVTHFDSDALEFRCELHREKKTLETVVQEFLNVPSYVERFKEGREKF